MSRLIYLRLDSLVWRKWRDSFTYVTTQPYMLWRIHVRHDPLVRRDLFRCGLSSNQHKQEKNDTTHLDVSRLIHICHGWYTCKTRLTRVTWLMQIWTTLKQRTQDNNDSSIYVTTHPYMSRLIQMCEDSFIHVTTDTWKTRLTRVTWLMQIWTILKQRTQNNNELTHPYDMTHSDVWRLIHTCHDWYMEDTTHSCDMTRADMDHPQTTQARRKPQGCICRGVIWHRCRQWSAPGLLLFPHFDGIVSVYDGVAMLCENKFTIVNREMHPMTQQSATFLQLLCFDGIIYIVWWP